MSIASSVEIGNYVCLAVSSLSFGTIMVVGGGLVFASSLFGVLALRAQGIENDSIFKFFIRLSPKQYSIYRLFPIVLAFLGLFNVFAWVVYRENIIAAPLWLGAALLQRVWLLGFEKSPAGKDTLGRIAQEVEGPRRIGLARLWVLIPFALAALIVCELMLPPGHKDVARITHLHGGVIHAEGQLSYENHMPGEFFDQARPGDTLNLELSRFFYLWDTADLIRDDQVVATSHSRHFYHLPIWVLLLLSTGVVFLPKKVLSRNWTGIRAWLCVVVAMSSLLLLVVLLVEMGLVVPPS